MSKDVLIEILNSKKFHATVSYAVAIGWLTFLSIFIFHVNYSLLQTQVGIAERVKNRYSSIDAAKDNRIQNIRIHDVERRVDILEAEAKRKDN